MKLLLSACTCLTLFMQFSKAQTPITVTGTVKDNKGDAVAYAFVRDWPANYAAYADSVGNFKLKVVPNSTLYINSPGYSGTTVNVANNTDFQVVLTSTGQSGASSAQVQTSGGNVAGSNSNQNFDFSGAMFVQRKEDTHGSIYFSDSWLHGYFIKQSDSLAQNPTYLYNYDKMSGMLVITQNRSSGLEVDGGQYKSFTLFDNSGNPYVFAKVPAIDNTHYVEVLSEGKKYSIYKSIKTRFKKADFSTNGMSSSGNNYDEYVDEFTYYVVKAGGQPQKLSLKTKSIKTIFSDDADKVNKFISDHSNDDINDSYLSQLGDSLND